MEKSKYIYIPNNYPVLKNWLIDIEHFTLEKKSHFNNYNMIEQNQILKENINNTNISNAIILEENVIMITYWPHCYGHILDSLMVIYTYYQQNYDFFYKNNYKIFLGYEPNNNIKELCDLFFKDIFINAFDFNTTNLVKIKNVYLIENHTENKNFFKWFNNDFKLTVRNYYTDDTKTSYDNVFLTRSVGTNPDRVAHNKYSTIDNYEYVDNFFSNNNFKIINPEYMTNKEVYNNIKNAKNIITLGGSGICQLFFIDNSKSKWFCLRAKRYISEFETKLHLPITSRFDWTYIDSIDNIISDSQLNYILNNLK